MDWIFDLIELIVDFGSTNVIVLLFRLIGLVLIFAGAGLWLRTDTPLLGLPGPLLLGGFLLVALSGPLAEKL